MSGGSMDYIYHRVDEAARMCEDVELAELQGWIERQWEEEL